MRRGAILLTALLAVMMPLAGCKKKANDAETALQFTEEELWKQSQEYLAKEKWKKASTYLKLLLDQYPAGSRAKEAHLAYADALFNRGSDPSLIEAQAKYLAFVAFYPEDDQTAYAQYRIGLCNYERRGKADRDQSITRAAISELEKVAQTYPKCPYVDDSRAKIRELRDELALHEYLVADFYRRRGYHGSSVQRVKFLLEKYPGYTRLDEAYLLLARELMRVEEPEEAASYLQRLLAEYPGSDLRKDAERMLDDAQHDERRAAKKREKESSGAQAPELEQNASPADGDSRGVRQP